MPDSPEERVRKWLQRQGYALEYEVANHLRRADFLPMQGQMYRDPTTQKMREIDVVGTLLTPGIDAPAYIEVVVECKRTNFPWVARAAEVPAPDTWRAIASARIPDYLEAKHTLAGLLRLEEPTPFDLIESGDPNRAGHSDAAYSAVAQVLAAAHGRLAYHRPMPSFVFPVIVIDGELFTLSYRRDGSEDLQQRGSVRMLWAGGDVPTVIDVVTKDAFASHANALAHALTGVYKAVQFAPPDTFYASRGIG